MRKRLQVKPKCIAQALLVQLRPLFVMILKECSPVEPLVLWDEYKLYICDDLHHRLIQLQFEQPTEDLIYDYGLYLIEEALQESGKSLKDYAPMPMSVNNWNAIVGNQLIAEQHNYNAVQECQSAAFDVAKMNRGQKHAFDSVVSSVDRKDGQLFFLNGPAGTGKMFCYNAICHKL